MKCPICADDSIKERFQVKEMMLGIGDFHTYWMCNNCGCLYLDKVPKDLGRYYPVDYYSFNRSSSSTSFFKRVFSAFRDRGVLLKTPWRFLASFKPPAHIVSMLSYLEIKKNTKILDVGSGSGLKIEPLLNAGFDVRGIDPYIEKDLIKGDLVVRKKDISEIDEKYDVIMFNHVFEHLANPLETLTMVADRLTEKGKCMLRIPVLPNAMWEEYRENWIQIDAPRHVFIHTYRSIDILSKASGFKIIKVVYDSTPFQMMGSELYSRGITMKEGDFRLAHNDHFTRKEIDQFQKDAQRLNHEGRGDQGAFYLEKVE